jgi:hypothetical protein
VNKSHSKYNALHIFSPFGNIFSPYRKFRQKLNNAKDLKQFEDKFARHFTHKTFAAGVSRLRLTTAFLEYIPGIFYTFC